MSLLRELGQQVPHQQLPAVRELFLLTLAGEFTDMGRQIAQFKFTRDRVELGEMSHPGCELLCAYNLIRERSQKPVGAQKREALDRHGALVSNRGEIDRPVDGSEQREASAGRGIRRRGRGDTGGQAQRQQPGQQAINRVDRNWTHNDALVRDSPICHTTSYCGEPGVSFVT